MLADLFNLVKEEATDSVINNPSIPNEKNEAVLADATHSVAAGLQSELADGGLQNVLSLFGGNTTQTPGTGRLLNNPIVGNIINNFTNKLTNNHGIPGSQASSIATSLITGVIGKLIHRSNDPNNSSFDIGSIIGSLTGGSMPANTGNGFDLQSMVNRFSEGKLDANNDGHIGFDDIINKITNGAKAEQQQNQSTGGGLLDTIKGFFVK